MDYLYVFLAAVFSGIPFWIGFSRGVREYFTGRILGAEIILAVCFISMVSQGFPAIGLILLIITSLIAGFILRWLNILAKVHLDPSLVMLIKIYLVVSMLYILLQKEFYFPQLITTAIFSLIVWLPIEIWSRTRVKTQN